MELNIGERGEETGLASKKWSMRERGGKAVEVNKKEVEVA